MHVEAVVEISRDAGSIPAASIFRPWCHPVPGADKRRQNPCYRRGFLLGVWPVPWSPGCQPMTANDRVCRLNHSQRTPRDFDLGFEVEGAIIDALDAHTTMSTQALESKQVQREIIKILLDHSSLYEDLRERASAV